MCLTDVQRVSQHQIAQAPQCIGHGGVGSFALQPVRRQPALLLFGEVSITPTSCSQDKMFDDTNYNMLYCHVDVAMNDIYSQELRKKKKRHLRGIKLWELNRNFFVAKVLWKDFFFLNQHIS